MLASACPVDTGKSLINLLITVVAAVIAIGVLVTVHEFGHYIVARACGIKVLRFSVGFGKPLWLRRAGPDQTEYVVSRIPLGGYVKMLDTREGEVAPEDLDRTFNSKPVTQRAAVLIAGPAFNFLFAIAAFAVVLAVGVPEARPFVGAVAADSDAARAGIAELDEIIAVDGVPTRTWGEANLALLEGLLRDGTIELEIRDERQRRREKTLVVSGDRAALTEPGALLTGLGLIPWQPTLPAEVGALVAGGPAERSGLLPGDVILSIQGVDVQDWSGLVEQLMARPGEQVLLEVRRGDRPVSLPVTLGSRESGARSVGYLGVEVAQPADVNALWGDKLTNVQLSPLSALTAAVGETWDNSILMLRMFGKMIVGDVSLKNISGPINIAQYAGYTAQDGPIYYLRFLALLSLSLGILNLLPIPMLDGGQLVYQVAEAVKGSPVSMRTEIIGQQIGIAMLLMLMGVAFYNDLSRLFTQ